ncbi:hypothetical protein [Streptomyces lavendulae]|uniref:hypothetical protein n=1 Tax=Streptomyces lavendulae TaxID=1914 RepID=UPI0033C6B88D
MKKTALFLTTAAALAASVMAATPAQASVSYQVNPTRACQQQYGGGVFGASHYKWSPDGLYCYGPSFPAAITWIGTLDKHRVYSCCRATYGNRADAKVGAGWRLPESAWWCVIS